MSPDLCTAHDACFAAIKTGQEQILERLVHGLNRIEDIVRENRREVDARLAKLEEEHARLSARVNVYFGMGVVVFGCLQLVVVPLAVLAARRLFGW